MEKSIPNQDGTSPNAALVLDDDGSSGDPLLVGNYYPLSPETETEVEAMLSEESSDEKSFYADAFMFVEQAAAKVVEISPRGLPDFVKLVHMDEIIEMTERLLEKQAEFLAAGKPCLVDIGYHVSLPRSHCP